MTLTFENFYRNGPTHSCHKPRALSSDVTFLSASANPKSCGYLGCTGISSWQHSANTIPVVREHILK